MYARGWRTGLIVSALLGVGSGVGGSVAHAEGTALDALPGLQEACRRSSEDGDRELFSVTVPANGWAFGRYDEQTGFLPIDTRRNLRFFRGSAEIFPSRLEPIGFVATPQRAEELVQSKATGSLRVGFFLGFDDPHRTACLIRPAAGVTTVRADIAYVELADGENRVIAREDTDRLVSWRDDHERDAIAGSGPRAQIGSATVNAPVVSQAWRDALTQLPGRSLVVQALGACHAQGISRGAAQQGELIARVTVDPRGAVQETQVELSTLGDAAEAECAARAIASGLSLPADPTLRAPVTISVPMRFAAD